MPLNENMGSKCLSCGKKFDWKKHDVCPHCGWNKKERWSKPWAWAYKVKINNKKD